MTDPLNAAQFMIEDSLYEAVAPTSIATSWIGAKVCGDGCARLELSRAGLKQLVSEYEQELALFTATFEVEN